MTRIKRAAKFLLHPDAQQRIIRLSFLIHWFLGGIAVVALFRSSPPLALALFVVGVIFFGVIAGFAAIVGAHAAWSLIFRAKNSASEFMTTSSKSLVTQLIYLAPGLLVGPPLLAFIVFLAE